MGTPFQDGTEGETRRGKLMADIAKENSIEHLVYSSVANADKSTGIPHFESKYKVERNWIIILEISLNQCVNLSVSSIQILSTALQILLTKKGVKALASYGKIPFIQELHNIETKNSMFQHSKILPHISQRCSFVEERLGFDAVPITIILMYEKM